MSAKPRPVILDDLALNIFTDGSSFSGPRAGGIGIRIITFDEGGNEVPDDYLLPGYRHATNQEMELKACIEALRIISGRRAPVNVRDYTKVVIHTDSQYVVDHWHNAFASWPRDRWRTRDGKPVVNAALWKDLVKSIRRVDKGWSSPGTRAIGPGTAQQGCRQACEGFGEGSAPPSDYATRRQARDH